MIIRNAVALALFTAVLYPHIAGADILDHFYPPPSPYARSTGAKAAAGVPATRAAAKQRVSADTPAATSPAQRNDS